MDARQVEPVAHHSSAFPNDVHSCRAQLEAFQQDSDNKMEFESYIRQEDNPQKRKHPFYFDPEFYAALDSSASDQVEAGGHSWMGQGSTLSQKGSPWPGTPFKKPRRATAGSDLLCLSESVRSSCVPSTSDPASPPATPEPASWYLGGQTSTQYEDCTRNFSTSSASNGPIIIDLSSGEELEALHLGENNHKRRRDSTGEQTLNPSSTDSRRKVFEFQEDGSLRPILVHCATRPIAVKKVRLGKLYDMQSYGS